MAYLYIYIYIYVSDALKKWTPNLDISPHQGDIYASEDPRFNHQYLGRKPETASDFPGKKSSSSLVISRHPRGSTVMIFDTWKTTYVLI